MRTASDFFEVGSNGQRPMFGTDGFATGFTPYFATCGLSEQVRQDGRQVRSLADHFSGVWVGMDPRPDVVDGWRGVTPPKGPDRDPPHVKVSPVALRRAAGNATHIYVEAVPDRVEADAQLVWDGLFSWQREMLSGGR